MIVKTASIYQVYLEDCQENGDTRLFRSIELTFQPNDTQYTHYEESVSPQCLRWTS